MLRFKCLVLFSSAVLLQLPLSIPVEGRRTTVLVFVLVHYSFSGSCPAFLRA